jgi:hypothetical protein
MSDRSNHPIPPNSSASETIDKAKEKEAQGKNDPELEPEGEAIDTAISGSLFLASRQELLEKEAELKKENEERNVRRKKA